MSANQAPIPPFKGTDLRPSFVGSVESNPSFWESATTWASENKALVYTVAGIAVVVTGAGAIYYFSDSGLQAKEKEERKASKKERRKAKKEAEAAAQQPLLREVKTEGTIE